jgi:hypothetical protein
LFSANTMDEHLFSIRPLKHAFEAYYAHIP